MPDLEVDVDATLYGEELGGGLRPAKIDGANQADADFLSEATGRAANVLLTAIRDNLIQLDLNTDAVEASLTSIFAELAEKLEAGDITGLATEAKQDTMVTAEQAIQAAVEQAELTNPGDAFKRLLKFEPVAGEEIRRDETLTDDYHGIAPDGTATSTASWSVCRFYKTAGLVTRVRYRTGVAWDSRTSGW